MELIPLTRANITGASLTDLAQLLVKWQGLTFIVSAQVEAQRNVKAIMREFKRRDARINTED